MSGGKELLVGEVRVAEVISFDILPIPLRFPHIILWNRQPRQPLPIVECAVPLLKRAAWVKTSHFHTSDGSDATLLCSCHHDASCEVVMIVVAFLMIDVFLVCTYIFLPVGDQRFDAGFYFTNTKLCV